MFGIFYILSYLLCFVRPVAAEVGTQYVFIIDDSGSMGLNYSGNTAADPNRLATFAASSMLMMLSVDDQVSIIRLNGGKDQPIKSGSRPAMSADSTPSMLPLKGHRKKILSSIDLDSKMAAYAGAATPCRSALNRAQSVLNSSYQRGVKQVVFFLTDGSCEPSSERVESANAWLNGLTSYRTNGFKFFLLTFEGRDFSKDLLQYTRNSEGIDIGRHVEVNADDPIGIITPFAEALAFSHGVEPIVLKPGRQEIPAHPAAAGVRLLSVDRDTNGMRIQVELKEKNQKGSNLGTVKRPRTMFHQWDASQNKYTYNSLRDAGETGAKFKSTALRYIPNTQVVWGEAENGSADWRVIAIPEYHLTMKTQFMEGDCSSLETLYAEGNNPRRGEQACILVSLHNHTKKNVTADMVEAFPEMRVEMKLNVNDESQMVTFKKIARNEYFAYPLQFSKLGQYKLLPSVQLLEQGLHLFGEVYEFSTYDVNIQTAPSDLNFGSLHLGGTDREKFEMTGDFKETEASFKINFDTPNPCIDILINDKKSGEILSVKKGTLLQATVQVSELCGNHSFDNDFSGSIVMQFPKDDYFQGRTVSLPWVLHLTSTLGVPEPMVITLDAGKSQDLNLAAAIPSIWQESPIDLDVVVAVQPTENWPDDLHLFFNGKTINEEGQKEAVLEETGLQHVAFSPAGQNGMEALSYHIQSERCCEGGEYTAKVLFRPNGDATSQMTQDLIVKINPKSKFDCYWPAIKNLLMALGIGLLLAYLYNIYRKTHFMNAKKISARFTPMLYRTRTSIKPTESDPIEVKNDIEVALIIQGVVNLSFRRLSKWFKGRFMTWVRANPLRLGLPGQPEYHECLQLYLTEDTDSFAVSLLPRLGMYRALSSPRSADITIPPNPGFYLVATSGKPKFFYLYNVGNLDSFRPKELHKEKESQDETHTASIVLHESKIYEVKPRPSKRNASAGWLLK